jgi:hypothetical protein
MTDQDFFPPLLELSPGEIQSHKRHLLREIAGEPKRSWRPLFAGVAAAGAAAAIAVALLPWAGGRTPKPRAAVLRPAPLYSFHASLTSRTPLDRYYSPDGSIGDHVYPAFDGVTSLPVSTKGIPRAVLELAAAQAHAYRNRGPTLVEWVRTSRQKAVSAENDGRVEGGGVPVYFVVIHGHFVYKAGSSPRPARLERARVMSYTLEVNNGRALDFGIGNGEPSFAKTGKPHHFVIYGRRRSR